MMFSSIAYVHISALTYCLKLASMNFERTIIEQLLIIAVICKTWICWLDWCYFRQFLKCHFIFSDKIFSDYVRKGNFGFQKLSRRGGTRSRLVLGGGGGCGGLGLTPPRDPPMSVSGSTSRSRNHPASATMDDRLKFMPTSKVFLWGIFRM